MAAKVRGFSIRAASPRRRRPSLALSVESLERREVPVVLPAGFAESVFAVGLDDPTAMEFAPDGRLFVAEQTGELRVVKDGTLLDAPFVALNVDSSGERGLLGVAFDPNFAQNQFIYLYYTVPSSPEHNRVSRFTANGDVAAAGSEHVILELNNLSGATNHNGGAIHFGGDGKLYVAVGDNANGANAQSMNTRHGKMLRINSDGGIPNDNPFFNTASGANRAIWATGLRNPFTFAVQPGAGRIFINDVGQGTFEEVNDGVAGSNYGWPTTEGPTNNPAFRSPIFAYGHDAGDPQGCAISGGAFYNPSTQQFPAEYEGDYFFADYCSGWIWRLDMPGGVASEFAAPEPSGFPGFVDLKVDAAGNLYYLARNTGNVFPAGEVRQIRYTADQAPSIAQHPSDRTVVVGQPASFTVMAGGTAPLSYQWQRDGANIDGATAMTFTLDSPTLADNGAMFRAMVQNAFGTATSTAATLTVTENQPPTGAITSPQANSRYRAGDSISFAGNGVDPEDGPLTVNGLTWRVDFHHADHVHPFVQPTNGVAGGSFTIPTQGETSADVFYRIILTVRDAFGLTHTSMRDVTPITSNITLATEPAGLEVTLDGQPFVAPRTTTSVEGMSRAIGATTPQVVGGRTFVFDSWSEGGAATHNITTPEADTTFTAVFREIPQVAFDAAASEGDEGVATAMIAVSLSTPADETVTVGYAVTGGTATGRDFRRGKGKLRFRPGTTTQFISLRIINDRIAEADETVNLQLVGPRRAVLGATTAHTFTIRDDDVARTVSPAFGQYRAAAPTSRSNTAASPTTLDANIVDRVLPRRDGSPRRGAVWRDGDHTNERGGSCRRRR
jgi:glucose/arabinose dehydrogenase